MKRIQQSAGRQGVMAGLMVCAGLGWSLQPAGAAETVRIALRPATVDMEAVAAGTDPLVTPKPLVLESAAAGEAAEALGLGSDARVTSVTLAGRTVLLGVDEKDGKLRYAARTEGGDAIRGEGSADRSDRSFVRLEMPLPGGSATLPIAVRATGAPPRLLRYFIPSYYEGIWPQKSGEAMKVALYDLEQSGGLPAPGASRLLIDLDGDGMYKTKSPTIESLDPKEPFRLGGVTYEVATDPDSRELILTPSNREATELTVLRVGAPAPQFTAEDSSGTKVALSDYRGKFVFFDVWATWCGPCRGEIPHIQKAHEKYGRDVVVLGVSIDGDKATAESFSAKEKMTYPQLWAPGEFQSEICRLYQVRGIPSTFLVDPEGKLVATGIRGEQIEEALQRAADYKAPENRAWFADKQAWSRLSAQVENLSSLGKTAEAVKLLQEHLKENPKSVNREAIERYVSYLEGEE